MTKPISSRKFNPIPTDCAVPDLPARGGVGVLSGKSRRRRLAKRVYPERTDSIGVWLYARGGTATVRTLNACEMEPIWPISH